MLISGLSGTGKTTIAQALEKRLFESGKTCIVLDGQSMRLGLCRDLGFTTEERSENLRRAAEIARLLNDSGLICLAAFVAPHEDTRQRVKRLIGNDRVLHVHLIASPMALQQREDFTKSEFASSQVSRQREFATNYEAPEAADLVLDTEWVDITTCTDRILDLILVRKLLNA